MTALLLDPHGDDGVLFSAFACIRYTPHVVVTHQTVPKDEIVRAYAELGCTVSLYEDLTEALEHHLRHTYFPMVVFAPAYEEEGHDEHNAVAQLARDVYGSRVTSYLTYAPRGWRSRDGRKVEINPNFDWVARKLRALSCFESQIEQPSTRPWFYELLDMREWVA